MMLQWHKFRSMYSEDTHVLAFRMGDFYEFFNNDARVVAKLLDITCTTRQEMPLAGFPYASGHESLEKIVQTGLHVIVVDQVEDPEEAKARGAKVVERGIVRIISPGTVLEETILDRHANNYLCSFRTEPLKKTERYLQVAIAICDLSTGEFFTTSFIDATDRFSLLNMEMLKLSPVEIVIPEAYDNDVVVTAIKDVLPQVTFTRLEDRWFDERFARETMLAHFDLHNLEGLGIEEKPLVVSVAGALVTYLRENQKSLLSNITACRHESPDEYMHLDHNTIRNLELVRNHADGSKRGTLLGLFSKTVTPMGTRHMKQFLLSPLLDREKIEERLDVVERLHSDLVLAESLRDV